MDCLALDLSLTVLIGRGPVKVLLAKLDATQRILSTGHEEVRGNSSSEDALLRHLAHLSRAGQST